jgi:hypothetical protein
MSALDKPRLRNSLRKLRALEAGLDPAVDRAELAQETLDLLAVQAGLKPAFLLGRGLDDPSWTSGVLSLALDMRLHAVEGPYWDATPFGGDIPGWYAGDALSALARRRAWYVCKAPAVARAVRRVCDGGARPTIAEEAALLGYPECCVAAHYGRGLAYHRALLSILQRRADGDQERMRSLLREEAHLKPETEAEKADFDRAMAVIPAPFGSWNLCDACAASGDSPSARLSSRYHALAEAIDRDWAAGLAVSAGPAPRWTR